MPLRTTLFSLVSDATGLRGRALHRLFRRKRILWNGKRMTTGYETPGDLWSFTGRLTVRGKDFTSALNLAMAGKFAAYSGTK
jgi:hypothetical protein